jgi:hypothetical protein
VHLESSEPWLFFWQTELPARRDPGRAGTHSDAIQNLFESALFQSIPDLFLNSSESADRFYAIIIMNYKLD